MRIYVFIIFSAIAIGLAIGVLTGFLSVNQRGWVDTWVEKEAEKPKAEEVVRDPKEPPVNENAPKAKVPHTVHDFGILDKNETTEKGEHDFTIENVGNDPLTLKDAGKGCMCTSFIISKESLRKGEKATVKVKWDASRGGGVFDQGVRVATNDPQQKEIFFNVRGLYTSPVVANPNQILFSGIQGTTESARPFRLFGFTKFDREGQPFDFQVLEATVTNPDFFEITLDKLSLSDLTDEEINHQLFRKTAFLYQGNIKVKPGLPQGAFQEVVRIRTNDPQMPVLEMLVEGQVAGSVKISGSKFDRHNSGLLAIGSVSTRNTTTEKLRLTVFDPMILTPETLKVVRKRPEWLNVELTYPDPEAQKAMPVKFIEVNTTIEAGSPMANFIGPAKETLGEIVFSLGENENATEIVVPVQFAVGP